MRLLAAIEPDQITQGAIAAIVVLAVVAFLVMRIIQTLLLCSAPGHGWHHAGRGAAHHPTRPAGAHR